MIHIFQCLSQESLPASLGSEGAYLVQITNEILGHQFIKILGKSHPRFVAFADPNSEQWHDAFDSASDRGAGHRAAARRGRAEKWIEEESINHELLKR